MRYAIGFPLTVLAVVICVVAVIGLIRGHVDWARISSREQAAFIAAPIGIVVALIAGSTLSPTKSDTAAPSEAAATSAPATAAEATTTTTTIAATTTVAPSPTTSPPAATTTTTTAIPAPPIATPESTSPEQTAAPSSNADQAFLDAIHDLGISGYSDHQLTNWGATSCVYMSSNGASAIETARELANTFPLTQRQGYLVVYEAIEYMCPDQKSKLPK